MRVPRPASFVKNLGAALAAKYWSSETAVMTTLAVLVGAGAGLGIALFRRLLDGLFARQPCARYRRGADGGLGGSAGPEDPSVQIGAALGSQVAQRPRLESAAGAELVELDLSQGDAGVGKQLIAECGTSKGSMLSPAARRAPVQGR